MVSWSGHFVSSLPKLWLQMKDQGGQALGQESSPVAENTAQLPNLPHRLYGERLLLGSLHLWV